MKTLTVSILNVEIKMTKARIFGVVMALIMMLPVVIVAYIADLKPALLKWQSIFILMCSCLAICALVDYLIDQKRKGTYEQDN